MKIMKVMNVAQSCLTLCDPIDYSPWNSPVQNTGAGSLSLLQGMPMKIKSIKPSQEHHTFTQQHYL